MVKRPDTGHEIYRPRVYGNFRTQRWYQDRKPAYQRLREKREANELNSAEHLAKIRQCECAVCGASPKHFVIHAHHLRGYLDLRRGLGQKGPDCATIPLCWYCHHEVEQLPSHRHPAHFKKLGFNDRHMAAALWDCHRRRGTAKDCQRIVVAFKLRTSALNMVAVSKGEKPVAGRKPRVFSVRPPAAD